MSNQLNILDRLMSKKMMDDKVYRRRHREYEKQMKQYCREYRRRQNPPA